MMNIDTITPATMPIFFIRRFSLSSFSKRALMSMSSLRRFMVPPQKSSRQSQDISRQAKSGDQTFRDASTAASEVV
jgi:hypothetical protein